MQRVDDRQHLRKDRIRLLRRQPTCAHIAQQFPAEMLLPHEKRGFPLFDALDVNDAIILHALHAHRTLFQLEESLQAHGLPLLQRYE